MRHYYDSRFFPFLENLLFDQLLNFDWKTSMKEIEEEREERLRSRKPRDRYKYKNLPEFKEEKCNYVSTELPLCRPKIYTPEFKLEDGVYTYVVHVGKEVKPENLKVDASENTLCVRYSTKTKNGSSAGSSLETMPEDLDVETMKAVLKNGVLTITAKQKELKKEEEPEEDLEFEIEIGK